MNDASYAGKLAQLLFRLRLSMRQLLPPPVCGAFSCDQADESIGRIYVINLDREDERWRRVRSELRGIRHGPMDRLATITRRFSAVDARYYRGSPSASELQLEYSLAEQLFVEPNPLLPKRESHERELVRMTRQETAVALSHIAVWRLIARSQVPYTLILEDDIYFRRGFAPNLEAAWAELMRRFPGPETFDVLYLSYKEARSPLPKVDVSNRLFRPLTGLWQLSGYVLSNHGANRLLGLLPVRGPVDLWINHRFGALDVFATHRPIIDQRPDSGSSNSYSILPVLAKVGALTREHPQVLKDRRLPRPVIAFGRHGTGLTSLAMGLSMLGYRCCSDVAALPQSEAGRLLGRRRGRVFDAYVNVGSLSEEHYLQLARSYPKARFILTDGPDNPNARGCDDLAARLRDLSARVLVLPTEHPDKWELLSRFLGVEYPSNPIPTCNDLGQRELSSVGERADINEWNIDVARLRPDSSPWIASEKGWRGIRLADAGWPGGAGNQTEVTDRFSHTESSRWALRDDTFPSNLSIFSPRNFTVSPDGYAHLTLHKERTSVRNYTSASIRSRHRFLHGKFAAEVKPAGVSGLVTGVFLHRNAPRQEIDIEFLGQDTTKMLVNVFYNPGGDGAKMEYGYRGTPALVELGFDAALDFHRYEIEWLTNSIHWLVDDRVVYERVIWDPTPIPHLPMEFNINLWYSRSKELAGPLTDEDLPAKTIVRRIETDAEVAPVGNVT